jgi:heat shock protein HtpX
VAHIQNGDMVTLTLIQGVVNAFVIFFARVIANVVRNMVDSRNAAMVGFAVTIVLDILLGILGAMIVAWFSRAREFRADAGAAQLSSRENMIGALKRLMQTHQLVDDRNQALATMKIAGGRKNWMAFFSTHPPLEARIAALEARGQSR